MKKSFRITCGILIAVMLSAPALAASKKGGGESQAGGLPALEDRVDADEALIATLQGQKQLGRGLIDRRSSSLI